MIDPHLHYRLHAGPVASPAETPGGTNVPSAPDPLMILVADRDTAVMSSKLRPQFPLLSTMLAGPAADLTTHCEPCHEIAVWKGRSVYATAVDSGDLDMISESGDLKREDFRSLYPGMNDVELGLLGRAIQMVDWYATSRYCSRCGSPTTVPGREAVAQCTACDHVQYPLLAPAMIVAVVRDGKLLLARAPRFKGAFHSVLAGFVEPGESVEECVRREVYEEAGIQVKNIRYFGSQSWPFPHSLMLGYTAEWDAGELRIDEEELEHADWYSAHSLPPVPSELSISGRLISWFRETHG